MNRKYLYIGLRILFVIAAVVLGIFAVYFIGKLIIPFIIGFFIALLINPLVDWLQIKTKMPRGFAVLTSIIIILAVISAAITRSEEHTSELQSRGHLVCRLLLEKKNNTICL